MRDLRDRGILAMRGESNFRFYQRRAAQERTAAARSVTNAARERHEELARHFAAQAEAMGAQYA